MAEGIAIALPQIPSAQLREITQSIPLVTPESDNQRHPSDAQIRHTSQGSEITRLFITQLRNRCMETRITTTPDLSLNSRQPATHIISPSPQRHHSTSTPNFYTVSHSNPLVTRYPGYMYHIVALVTPDQTTSLTEPVTSRQRKPQPSTHPTSTSPAPAPRPNQHQPSKKIASPCVPVPTLQRRAISIT